MRQNSIVILYNELPATALVDELDVLLQVEAVETSLQHLGYTVTRLQFTQNIDALVGTLVATNPLMVFNLVESILSEGRLSYLAPAILDKVGLKYTGNSAVALWLTTDKLATKQALKALGIATPPWVSMSDFDGHIAHDTYIIKGIYEDASIGISQDSIVRLGNVGEARQLLMDMYAMNHRNLFIEKYIDGREFTLSLLGEGGKPQVLAPVEVPFDGYLHRNLSKIIDYRAKWEVNSFEYQHTAPTIATRPEDRSLLEELEAIALTCWEYFRLKGYARIDFRVDHDGKPWVLEINANPCLTPDNSNGFAQSARASGLTFDSVVSRILDEARGQVLTCSLLHSL